MSSLGYQQSQLAACEECGLVSQLPTIKEGQVAKCPRCAHTLSSLAKQPCQTLMAFSVASLLMLVMSLIFPFMSFSVKGITHEIFLINTVDMLEAFEQSALALLLLMSVLVLPAVYVAVMGWIYWRILRNRPHGKTLSRKWMRVCKLLAQIEPWIMADVFLIGVLVSLVKISAMAEIGLGYSFWAFCMYTILIVKTLSLVDPVWLWQQIQPSLSVEGVRSGDDHLSGTYTACHHCHQLNPKVTSGACRCVRCSSTLHGYNPKLSLQRAWAYLIAAVIFYFPANLYPIMYTVSLGSETSSTILQGVVVLWQLGSYPIAAVIFIASIFIPMAKMLALAWIYWNARHPQSLLFGQALKRQKLYRVTEFIGRWSMIDIFVVAILVALIQLHNLMAITPGPASLSFAAVVILTMLSAISFDSRVIWSGSRPLKELHLNE